MATCPHFDQFNFKPPGSSTSVYKEECTQCFKSTFDGLLVCLTCFNAGCEEHARHHSRLSSHSLVMRLSQSLKEQSGKSDQESPPPPKKVQIVEKSEADYLHTETSLFCLGCDKTITGEKAEAIISSTLSATSAKQKEQIQSWEEKIEACEHTLCLEQLATKSHASQNCDNCEKSEGLWLCLTCGNVGCSRRQYDGSGGNNHALNHYDSTKHPISCKLGTITPEGTADIYCYICDEMRADPYLSMHLATFGIEVETQQKTEKSMAELQLEQNLKFEFNMATEDGKSFLPVFGPGLTGLKNIGNSCYMGSVLQSIGTLPFFNRLQQLHDIKNCSSLTPAKCVGCQLYKLSHGLNSGVFAIPSIRTHQIPDHTTFQDGIPPTMFKALSCKDHDEFRTARQQDAYEFLQFILEYLDKNSGENVSREFETELSHRTECTECHHVGYSSENSTSISLRMAQSLDESKFSSCLENFTSDSTIDDFHCPKCRKKVTALRRTRFKKFPKYLTCYIQRFVLENWVPKKLNTPLILDSETIDLSPFKTDGNPLPNEQLFPEETSQTTVNVSEEDIDNISAMGFSRPQAIKALKQTAGQGLEAAMEWIFSHPDDQGEEEHTDNTASKQAIADQGTVQFIMDMGFSRPQALKALRINDNNPEASVEWLFSHPEDMGDVDELYSAPSSSTTASSTFGPSYKLHSIVSHKGPSVHCGHYVALVNHETNGWVLFNDEKVVQVSIDRVIGNSAIDAALQGYVLIWRNSQS